MRPVWDDLLRAVIDPQSMLALDESRWDLVLRQAYAAGLLGRLGHLAQQQGIEQQLPRPVWHAMEAMLTLVAQQQRAVRWELLHLQRVLAGLPGPVLLLKGAAYAAEGLPPAGGRLFSDIDILLPRDQLDAAEAALMLGGWISEAREAYDQRYYRQWMHELPPMTQVSRGTTLDVHHRLLPLTARIQTDPAPVLQASVPVAGFPGFARPQSLDMVLHSACHLFHEGEWGHGLRDLVDLDALLRAELRSRGSSLWPELLDRAARLKLGRPLFYALRYCARLLHTPVPPEILSRCPDRAGALHSAWMDALLLRGFGSAHPGSQRVGTSVANFLLYVRSHYLRMPPHLLLPHLLTKAWMRWSEKRQAKEQAALPGAEGG